MVTALQIALLLILIALIGIILGYLFGRLACKKREEALYIEKSNYCEEQYNKSLLEDSYSGSVNQSYNSDFIAALNDEKSNLSKEMQVGSKEKSSKSPEAVVESLLDESATQEEIAEESSQIATLAKSIDADTNEVEKLEKSDTLEDTNKIEEVINDKHKPEVLTEPINGEKDNLTRIKGIGNVIEGKLNDLGIFHFEQIAAWTENEIRWVDTHLAFSGRIIREDWIGQAKKLAKGEETEFSKRVDNGEVPTSKAE